MKKNWKTWPLPSREHGLIQPVVLRSVGAGYEIVAGERRWRAARKAGVRNIPCIVRELSDEENMLLAIIENMQREDLNPIEEAEGINQMIETYGLTQDQVSKSVGKSRPYITNCLRLLKLPEDIQSLYQRDSSPPVMRERLYQQETKKSRSHWQKKQ